jgi:hypothetical protein
MILVLDISSQVLVCLKKKIRYQRLPCFAFLFIFFSSWVYTETVSFGNFLALLVEEDPEVPLSALFQSKEDTRIDSSTFLN